MVVDDEERVRTFLSRSLGVEGHSVISVADGTAALEALIDASGGPGRCWTW